MRRGKGRAGARVGQLSCDRSQLSSAAAPELALLKAQYKVEFEAAIRTALAALGDRDRTILLMHLVDGVTLPRLALLQGVSRATVARWLASARDALHDGTREALRAHVKLSDSEYASLAGLVRSQLELSVIQAVAPR